MVQIGNVNHLVCKQDESMDSYSYMSIDNQNNQQFYVPENRRTFIFVAYQYITSNRNLSARFYWFNMR